MGHWPHYGDSGRRLFASYCQPQLGIGSSQIKEKLQFLLLAISTLDQPVGLLDGRLVHKNRVLCVAGLQGVVLLVLVSCSGKETR